MTHHLLIEDLSNRLKPVTPLPRLRFLVVFLLACAIGVAACYLGYSEIRTDLPTVGISGSFISSEVVLGLLVVLSLLSIVCDLVPGYRHTPIEKHGWFSVVLLWHLGLGLLLWNGSLQATWSELDPSIYWPCFVTVSQIAIAPIVVFFIFLRWGMPQSRYVTGLKAAISSAALGAFLVAFTCPADDPSHVFFSHTLPIIALVGCTWAVIATAHFIHLKMQV